LSEKSLEEAILERLQTVMDPETSTDVIRMRLVENLWADARGKVRYTFARRRLSVRLPFRWQWKSRKLWLKCPA